METLKNLDKLLEAKLTIKNNSSQLKFNSDSILFECNENNKNRFYFENLSDDCFFDVSGPTDDFFNFYKKIIKSGVGTIVMGGVKAGLTDVFINNQARISLDNKTLLKYKNITKLAHSNKTKILLKINSNIGRFNNSLISKKALKYGSNFCIDPENRHKLVLRISDNKCNELVSDISQTVLYSNVCDFDGVMIDASLSNVIGELSSIELNKRKFGYFSNPNDFLIKTLKNIDTKNNYIILKLNILSLFEIQENNLDLCKNGKLNFEQIISNIKQYINLGVDGFEFVFGRYENEFLSSFNQFQNELLFEEFIKDFRDWLNTNNIKTIKGNDVEIFYSDNVFNVSKLEQLIINHSVDYFDVTKNILSDLNFLKNAKLIQNCLKCSYCNKISREKHNIECLINPDLMNFEEYKIESKLKKVAIVGSGISALICSLTLLKRGFKVDIFEEKDRLNHYGYLTTVFGFDKTLENYFKYIESQINEYQKKGNLNIFLNTKFNSDFENKNKYYSIIIATGFKTKFLAVNGAIQNHVHNIYDSLKHKKQVLSKNNIVIYAKSDLSLKLALFLISNNKNVSIVIKDIKSFYLNKNANMFYFFYKLYKNNVNIYLLSRITKINEDNIDLIINKNLRSKSIGDLFKLISQSRIKEDNRLINIDCDYLIYEPEITPNNKLYADLVNSKYKGELYLIGNALENSNFADTIKSGFFVGKNL